MIAAILLLGCSMGPSAETLIDELRVVAMLADLPEAGPGETVSVTTLTTDPQQRGYDTLTWGCTFDGEACAEAAGRSNGVWDGLVLSDTEPFVYAIPAAFSSFLTEEPLPLVQVWSLSCEPGLCPPIEAARDLTTADAAELQGWLTDPTSVLADLPMEGVSLGLRSLLLSTRSADERVTNPTIACTPDEGALSATVTEELVLTCTVDGDITDRSSVWGYATGGGWGDASLNLETGDTEVAYSWFAPEEAGEVEAWVLAIDGAGGVGLWSETLAAEEE